MTAGIAPLIAIVLVSLAPGGGSEKNVRPRARDVGVIVGELRPGPLNAITDIAGVAVGHTTLIRGRDVRTGVTAILPHGGNLFREKVPAAVFVGNGFGKLMGLTQVQELGEIETPILLTSTLSVPRAGDALLDYVLTQPGNEDVRSVNPVVAETNDGYVLNDGRGRHISREDVLAAIRNAKGGPVEEGAVGAGTGTVAFEFKGGIGTSSRRLGAWANNCTVGVLVQTNFGGFLTIAGVPVGRELAREKQRRTVRRGESPSAADGSVIVVVATDAPLDARSLRRLAARSMFGLARTGSWASNSSGDYAIAFSTASEVRIRPAAKGKEYMPRPVATLSNDAMSPLFLAAIEATEEAIYNSLFKAVTMTGCGQTVEALPLDRTLAILQRHGALKDRK
jgi:D-aminopeptidase